MATFQTTRFDQFDGPLFLHFADISTRELSAAEALLNVGAVGLNRAESMYYHGPCFKQPELPSELGYEDVGTVKAVGAGIDASLVDRCLGKIPGYSMNRHPVHAKSAVALDRVDECEKLTTWEAI